MEREGLPDSPRPELRYKRRIRLTGAARELYQFRELVRTIAERELRARYKQTLLGFAWALITPVALMLVFTVVVRRIGPVETHGVPYPLFAYLGLLPWTFFSTSLSLGSQSLVMNWGILNKVYCPREVFPMASMLVAGVDVAIATTGLGVLFLLTGVLPRVTTVWVPLLSAVQIAFTLGVTLLVSAILIYLRDVRHLLPIVLQLGLFATPVAYGVELVPESLRGLYAALNPLAPVIDGYRRTVLQGLPPDWGLVAPGAFAAAAWLLVGYTIFKHLEMGFADVA